jgi:hypothetical protein
VCGPCFYFLAELLWSTTCCSACERTLSWPAREPPRSGAATERAAPFRQQLWSWLTLVFSLSPFGCEELCPAHPHSVLAPRRQMTAGSDQSSADKQRCPYRSQSPAHSMSQPYVLAARRRCPWQWLGRRSTARTAGWQHSPMCYVAGNGGGTEADRARIASSLVSCLQPSSFTAKCGAG